MTTPSPFSITIPRRNQRCSKNQELLAPGSEYFSVLEEDDNGVIVRNDYCKSCWEEITKKETIAKAKSYWKSVVPQKTKEPIPTQNREEKAMSLLKQHLELNAPETQAEAFILSLYLSRKRLLHMRQQIKQADGQIMTLYEVADTEEMLGIKKLALSQLEIVSLQQSLAQKLKNN